MYPIRQYKEDRNARMQIHEDIYARKGAAWRRSWWHSTRSILT
jgi:hypothetical protein